MRGSNTVQALARENDPSQVAGTDAFKNKEFGALVQAARESQEVFEPSRQIRTTSIGSWRCWRT